MGAVKTDANKRPATDTHNNHAYSKSKAGVGIANGVVILTILACTLYIAMRNIRRKRVREGAKRSSERPGRTESYATKH